MTKSLHPGVYRLVYADRLWQHPRFVALSATQQLVALYVLTGPQTNRAGFYRLSIAVATEDHVRLSAEDFADALRVVCDAFGWRYDAHARVLWVPSWLRWNPPANQNSLHAVLKDVAATVTSTLRDAFLAGLPACLPDAVRGSLPGLLQAVGLNDDGNRQGNRRSNRNANGSENGSSNGQGNCQSNRNGNLARPKKQEAVTENKDQDQDPPPTSVLEDQNALGSPRGTRARLDKDPLFTRFWTAYPRKVSREDAWIAWKKLHVDEPLLQQMLAAIAWQTTSDQWTRDGEAYIPYPATWLNQRRWEDERPGGWVAGAASASATTEDDEFRRVMNTRDEHDPETGEVMRRREWPSGRVLWERAPKAKA